MAKLEAKHINISIHAPTRGATADTARLYLTGVNFNPRSHKGSDTSKCLVDGYSQDFNPRSHKGSDSR